LRWDACPNSPFPVHLKLDDVVTHNTAILGVTGSGKSYLAFWIISGLVKSGVKVFVLDISRQHWVFLKSLAPTAIKTVDEVEAWYNSESKVGIHQFANSTNYPQTTAEFVERLFKQLEKIIKLKPGENEPAHVCIVFEEAHSLIPEWNQVAQRGDEAYVNRTARTVLQGRKYGLGCLLISQRTANVTKTILNQCNTIIGLQSFDQTGLDFLSNYMGTAYANVISTLPPRHAVLVGKASSSTRPILFQITDLNQHWAEKEEGTEHPAAADAVSVDLAAVAEDAETKDPTQD
jgi:DNA helicase HerA-like ATPase